MSVKAWHQQIEKKWGIHLSPSHTHTNTHLGVEGLRQSNCMSPLPVISGMSVRQVGADTVDIQCVAFAHIFYSECFLASSATLTLPPTPSNQYIISSHYACMHIYKAARVDNRGERLVRRVRVAVSEGVGSVCSAVRSAGFLLRKLKLFFLCVFAFFMFLHTCRRAPAQDRVV